MQLFAHEHKQYACLPTGMAVTLSAVESTRYLLGVNFTDTSTSLNTIQYNTIQYNTIQYNTIQYNTIQYNTM